MSVTEFASVASSIATLLMAVGALIVFIGVFFLLIRLGHAVEMMSEQIGISRRDRETSP